MLIANFTADGDALDDTLSVTSGQASRFQVGLTVAVIDTLSGEVATVTAVDTTLDTIDVTDLTNSYTTANSAFVSFKFSDITDVETRGQATRDALKSIPEMPFLVVFGTVTIFGGVIIVAGGGIMLLMATIGLVLAWASAAGAIDIGILVTLAMLVFGGGLALNFRKWGQ